MREKLNSNPVMQAAVLGVLLIGTAFFLLSSMGGGEEEEGGLNETSSETTVTISGEGAAGGVGSLADALALVNKAAVETPPLPGPVLQAWKANRILVMLFVRNGGIDDRLVRNATAGLKPFREVAVFVVPARRISRYAAITQGTGVDRVPALVVVSPKNLDRLVPTASVSYGYQSPESIAQAVIDAGYEGPTVDYHP